MGFLQDQCSFGFYNHEKADTSKPFRCGDDDLDEFFTDDAFLQSDELLCKNYCFTLGDDPSVIVAAFTLSNDSIKKIPGSRKKKVEKNLSTSAMASIIFSAQRNKSASSEASSQNVRLTVV